MLLPVDLMMEGKFSAIVLKEKENEFLSSAVFLQLLSGIPSVCQTVCIQIRPDILGPNCLQRLAPAYTSRQRVKYGPHCKKV